MQKWLRRAAMAIAANSPDAKAKPMDRSRHPAYCDVM